MMCLAKVAFATEEAAAHSAYEASLISRTDPRLRPYRCPECRCWHLYTTLKTPAIELSHRIREAAGWWSDRIRIRKRSRPRRF